MSVKKKLLKSVSVPGLIKAGVFIAFVSPSTAYAGFICDSNPTGSGGSATAAGADAVACGNAAAAGGNNSSAYGVNSIANGPSDVAIGDSAEATNPLPFSVPGTGATAVGNTSGAYGLQAAAFGASAKAYGSSTTAVGGGAIAGDPVDPINTNSAGAVAVGVSAKAKKTLSTATGFFSTAEEVGSAAYGSLAEAKAENALAMGYKAKANNLNDVALGANSETLPVNTGDYTITGGTAAGTTSSSVVSVGSGAFGTRQIQNVGAGVVSASSTDAVNGSQLYAVGVATNNLGTTTARALGGGSTYTPGLGVSDPTYRIQGRNYNDVGSALGAVDNSLTSLNNGLGVLGWNVSSLSNRVDGNQREARQGIAMAASMAQAPMPSAAGKTTWKFNNSIYKGYTATSLSLSHRLPTAVPVALTGGVAMGFRNSALFTAGLQGEF